MYRLKSTKRAILLSAALVSVLIPTSVSAQYKMSTPLPEGITTPDVTQTSIGILNFRDGLPEAATIEKIYQNLDLMRSVNAYIHAIPGVAMLQTKKSLAKSGISNGSVALFDGFMDSNHRFLNGNSETIYALTWIDLSDGPIVIDLPPGVLGGINDLWQRWVADIGISGEDKGEGGKYLILPPNYSAPIPSGYTVIHTPGYQNLFFIRGLLTGMTQKAAITNIRKLKIYPLRQANDLPETRFTSMTDVPIDVIFRGDDVLFSDLNEIIQSEPPEFLNPEMLGLFAAIGIEKGKEFSPDARMTAILKDAAAIGNATARTISFRPRDKQVYLKPDVSSWFLIFGGNDYRFIRNGYVNVDARILFHYSYTGTSPAMANEIIGIGSQYASNVLDSTGKYLDGSQNYHMRMPPNIPVKDFWSLIVFDPQTRSMLQTDQRFPSISSQRKGLISNADGSIDIYFGPRPPKGKEHNWIQTIPGRSWFATLRMYGPLEAWFDRTWIPGEITRFDNQDQNQ